MNAVPSGFTIVLLYLILMLGLGLVLSLIDFSQKKYRLTLRNLCVIWAMYTLDWAVRILSIILAIPLIVLLFILQPVMAIAFLIAFFLLVIFCVGLFYEEPIVAHPPTSKEALWAILTIVGCIGIWLLVSKIFKSEDDLFSRYADFFVTRIHQPIQQVAKQLLQEMDD